MIALGGEIFGQTVILVRLDIRQRSTPGESIVTPYVALPKPATATVQGVLGPNLLQKFLWSAKNLLSNEFVGHSCSVQL